MSHGPAPRRFLRARLWLASAMWVPVLAANAAAIVVALALPVLDEQLGERRPRPIGASAAEQIFGALAAGMITFTGIIFSAVFVAAQIQTSSYSPRLAARLRRDPVLITGLALPTATATYSLFAIAAIAAQGHRAGRAFAPTLTVIFGLVLLVVTLGAFVALVQRAFELTQIGGIFRGLMRRAQAVIDDVHPLGAATPGDAAASASDPRRRRSSCTRGPPPSSRRSTARRWCASPARPAGSSRCSRWSASTWRRDAGPERPRRRLRPAGDHAHRVLVLARQRTIDQDPGVRAADARRHRDPRSVTRGQRSDDRRPGARPARGAARRAASPRPGAGRWSWTTTAPRAGRVPAPTWTATSSSRSPRSATTAAARSRSAGACTRSTTTCSRRWTRRARARVELERRLLGEALAAAFPDPEERAIAARSDRLGLGDAASPALGDAPPAAGAGSSRHEPRSRPHDL